LRLWVWGLGFISTYIPYGYEVKILYEPYIYTYIPYECEVKIPYECEGNEMRACRVPKIFDYKTERYWITRQRDIRLQDREILDYKTGDYKMSPKIFDYKTERLQDSSFGYKMCYCLVIFCLVM